jgi:hypothetical protein
MSQDKPNSSDSESQPSVTQPPSSKQTSLQMLRSTSAKVLRSTSRALETVATRLENSDGASPLLPPKLQSQLRALWHRFLPLWSKLLRQIRNRLSGDINQKLGDRALSGIVVSVAIALFWVTSSLFSSKPAEVALVKATPRVEPITPDRVIPLPTSFPAELTAPSEETSASKTISEVPVSEEPVSEEPVSEVPIPELAPTPEPTPEAIVAEEPELAPLPELTPEEKLIASIHDRLAEVAEPYASELIRSVQPNRSSRLTVQVNPSWYTLSASQQNELADKLLNRSQDLDFGQLKITDSEGSLLARSPVVGSSMVILKRTLQT